MDHPRSSASVSIVIGVARQIRPLPPTGLAPRTAMFLITPYQDGILDVCSHRISGGVRILWSIFRLYSYNHCTQRPT